MLNGNALLAQAKLVTAPYRYAGGDLRVGMRDLLTTYMPNLEVRLEGAEVDGEFEVEAGGTVFDTLAEVGECLDIVLEWWSDAVVIRPNGQGASLATFMRR